MSRPRTSIRLGNAKTPCNRCGIPREVKPDRPGTGLCSSCLSVLSKAEKELWAA